ncbi:unnamed protein product, partial [Polarella glacialis]
MCSSFAVPNNNADAGHVLAPPRPTPCRTRYSELGPRYYTAQISSLGRQRNWPRALGVLELMVEGRLQPGIISFNAALSACERSQQWSVALALLRRVRLLASPEQSDGLAADVVTFGTVMGALQGAGRWWLSLELLDQQCFAGLRPNGITLGKAATSAAFGGLWALSTRLLLGGSSLQERGSPESSPGDLGLNSGLSAMASGSFWCQAVALLSAALTEGGLRPGVVSYSAAISACAHDVVSAEPGLWRVAFALFAALRHALRRSSASCSNGGILGPDAKVYGAALSAVEKAGVWEMAVLLLAHLASEPGLKVDAVPVNTAISATGRASRWEVSILLCQAFRQGIEPTVVTQSSLLAALARASRWEPALSALVGMQAEGPKPTVVAWNAVAVSLDKACQWRQAVGLMRRLAGISLEPSSVSFALVVSACRSASFWRSAASLFAALPAKGVSPSPAARDAAMDALAGARQWEQSLQLSAGISKQESIDFGPE